jgi:soluble lytic murein transglycosylase-like protein
MNYLAMIYLAAIGSGLDPNLAISVAQVESNMNPNAVGTKGDIGLFQVRHSVVKVAPSKLRDPEVNTQYGIKLLTAAKKSCPDFPGDSWLVCYNRGVAGGSKIRRPANDKYYLKVMKVYNSLKNKTYLDHLEAK